MVSSLVAAVLLTLIIIAVLMVLFVVFVVHKGNRRKQEGRLPPDARDEQALAKIAKGR